ncbi:MAG: DapH/DapD/GlmU-related protein [Bdellovibrionales bacterium]
MGTDLKKSEVFDPSRTDSGVELKAFLAFRESGRIPLKYMIPLGIKSLLFDIPYAILQYWPGPVGMKLRQIYFKFKFHTMGKNVIIGASADIQMPSAISVSDYAFIDHHVSLNAMAGNIHIGRRIHIAPYAIISGVGGGIYLGDYAAVGAFARIYSHSEAPVDGKRLSGPMIPESMKGMVTGPVHIGKDALIGTGAVVLPGVTLGEGAIVAANSFVPAHTKIPPYAIYGGVPAKMLGLRQKITVEDI